MRPFVMLDLKRSAVREAVSRFLTANLRVDLLTPGDLPQKFRTKVLAEARPV